MSKYVSPDDAKYPAKLQDHLQDPKKIYYRGELDLACKPSIAIVGSRKCTPYGITVARVLSTKAAEYGAVIVSGLARGIDSAAHRGALSAGGKTAAVLANGCDMCYPSENRGLQSRIACDGLLISEYPDGVPARRFAFPVRNRIVAALADAVVIVEAGIRSGSLITAEAAAEQGKSVFAVPGNITSSASAGTNRLIREGAIPLVFFDDLFGAAGLRMGSADAARDRLGATERRVFDVLSEWGSMSMDEICHKADIKPSEIGGIITILEMKGMVQCEMGKVIIANFDA